MVSLDHNELSEGIELLKCLLGTLPGGVLGPKNDGDVPLAAENWTQKDRGKNEIWGLKDRIL